MSDVPGAVRQGVRAIVVAQVITQVFSLVVLAVLYRRIGPVPFGYMGMAVPLILLLRVFSSFGLNIATIQRPDISRDELNALFWVQQVCGGLTFLLTAVCAPFLAAIYQVADLVPIVLALSGTTILVSLAAQHQALMERHLRIKQLTFIRLIAQLVGGIVAVAAAYADWGVWALVSQQYVEWLIILVSVWTFEPWRPRRPGPIGSLGELLVFGGYWTGRSLILAFGQYVDKFLLALWMAASPSGLAAVGMYTQAFQLMQKPVLLVTAPISGVMLPALARVVTDSVSYRSFLHSFYRMVAIVLFPCGVGLAIVAGDTMQVLGGQRWVSAGWILTLLAPAVLAQGFINLSGSVFAAAGRNDRLLRASLVMTCGMTVGYLIGISLGSHWGPSEIGPAIGLAMAYSFLLLGFVYPYTAYAWKSAGVELHGLIVHLRRPVLATCAMGLAIISLRAVLNWLPVSSASWRVGAMILLGAVIYSYIACKDLIWLRQQMLDKSHQAVEGSDPS